MKMEEDNTIPIIVKKKVVGAHKSCCYGLCKSGSRSKANVKLCHFYFISFPKPCLKFRKGEINNASLKVHFRTCEACRKCKKWVKLCGRQDSKFRSIRKVTKDTNICSLHFIGESGPTEEHPDPIECRPKIIKEGVKKARGSLEKKYQHFSPKPEKFTSSTGNSCFAGEEKSGETN